MIWIFAAVTAVAAYLLGSINSGIIISKLISGKDIRESGSGNAGATNMLRTHGKKAGVMTLLCDMLKGVIAVSIALLIGYIVRKNIVPEDYLEKPISMTVPMLFGRETNDLQLFWILPNLKYIAALFVVLGHIFPIFFGFKGGKGIATAGAVILMLNWKIGLAVLIIALLVMAVSRYVSLGSVTAAAAYPVIVLGYLLGTGGFKDDVAASAAQLIFALVIAYICIVKHKANIKRLIAGEENKLGSKKSKEE